MAASAKQMAEELARRVAALGGRAFYVGGYVRDALLGRDCKDVDVEVHGVPVEDLRAVIGSLGTLTEMGASFGIFGLAGFDLDIAMPRKEHATGAGHKDFAVFVDPYLGTQKAATRRDFTVNALMQDVLTGEVIDHFGGKADLAAGVLRHVQADTFVEDPLRVLRGAQFAARFGFSVAPETTALMATMDLSALAPERIMGELSKALLKAERPSVFFEELRRARQLDGWFAELAALWGVPQPPQWHPEGCAYTHTLLVLDAAATLREQAQWPLAFMLAALCHDFGKATTTAEIDGRIRAFGHETEGVPMAGAFVRRLTRERRLAGYVENMVRLHMRPNMMVGQGSRQKAWNRLFDESVCPNDLLLLAKADFLGCGGVTPEQVAPTERAEREHLAVFEEVMSRPFVSGADLVAAGLRPGPYFGDALAHAHKLRLAGIEKENALKQTLSFAETLY